MLGPGSKYQNKFYVWPKKEPLTQDNYNQKDLKIRTIRILEHQYCCMYVELINVM